MSSPVHVVHTVCTQCAHSAHTACTQCAVCSIGVLLVASTRLGTVSGNGRLADHHSHTAPGVMEERPTEGAHSSEGGGRPGPARQDLTKTDKSLGRH